MKKSLIVTLLLSSLSFADTTSIEPGWNLLGAGDQEIDLNATFWDKSVSIVWGFENIQKNWIGYSPDSSISQLLVTNGLSGFEHVPTNMGYWVKSNYTTMETITLEYRQSSDTANSAYTWEKLQGKTFFLVREDGTFGAVSYSDTIEGERQIAFSTFDNSTAPVSFYTITESGLIDLGGTKLELTSEGSIYNEMLIHSPDGLTSTYQRAYHTQADAQAYLTELLAAETPALITITFNAKEYGTVISPYTDKVWLDRNLGADQVCTSSTDSACYGDYYEWGRLTDGHEKTTSASTTIQSSDIANAGTDFIGTSSMGDWASVDKNGYLRSVQWSKTDGTSICPTGFRVPSIDELIAETTTLTSDDDGINNFLKLPKSGIRYYNSLDAGNEIKLWSSTHYTDDSDFSPSLNVDVENGGGMNMSTWRTYGQPVRCIKD